MEKIKRIFSEVWRKVKKRPYIGILLSLALLFFILFSPILHSNWLLYPESLKLRIALDKLLQSMESDKYCREDCSIRRTMYENVISRAIKNNPEAAYKILEKYIFDLSLAPEIRKELLKIIKISGADISDRMKGYVSDPANNLDVRMQIARAWPEAYPSLLEEELPGNYKKLRKTEDKLNALEALKGQSGKEAVFLLWNILDSDEKDELKSQALFLLSNLEDKSQAYFSEDLNKLKIILEKSESSPRLQDRVIFLLNEYYDYFPDQSAALLIEVVNSPLYDPYQKSFAINILNTHRLIPLPLPELSEDDWNSYYNN